MCGSTYFCTYWFLLLSMSTDWGWNPQLWYMGSTLEATELPVQVKTVIFKLLSGVGSCVCNGCSTYSGKNIAVYIF